MKIYFILLVCLSIIPYRVLFHKPHIEQIKIRVGKDYKPISVFKEEPVIWKFKVKKRKLGLKKKELRKANKIVLRMATPP